MTSSSYLYERIVKGQIAKSYMQFWKALVEEEKIFLIVACQDSWKAFLKCCGNELAVLMPIRVSYLKEDEARNLICRPTMRQNGDKQEKRFLGGCEDLLVRLTAGSAYLIQALLKLLIEYMNEKKMNFVTEGELEYFLRDRIYGGGANVLDSKYFEPQLNDEQDGAADPIRTQDNGRFLRALASYNIATEWIPLDSTRMDFPRERQMDLLTRLQQRDVIVTRSNKNGIEVKFVVPLLREWLKHNAI